MASQSLEERGAVVIFQDMTHRVGEITWNLASKRLGSKVQIAKS